MRLSAIGLVLVLASCLTEQATLSTPAQPFTQATNTPTAVVPMPAGGKYKFKEPVAIIVQAGTSNVATPTVRNRLKRTYART